MRSKVLVAHARQRVGWTSFILLFPFSWVGAAAAIPATVPVVSGAMVPASAEPLNEAEVAAFAIRQNQQSYEKVKNVSFEFRSVVRGGTPATTQETRGFAKRRGDMGFEQVDQVTTDNAAIVLPAAPAKTGGATTFGAGDATGATKVVERIRFYRGPDSVGRWSNLTQAAEQHMHADVASMSPHAKQISQLLEPPHTEWYVFGSGSRLLSDLLQSTIEKPEIYRWGARELLQEGERIFQLTVFIKLSKSEFPSVILFVDPKRGFVVRRAEHRHKDGRLIREFDTDVADLTGSGVWFATRVVDSYYNLRPAPLSTREITFQNVLVNPPFTASDFTVAALDVPSGARLIRTASNGTTTGLIRTPGGFDLRPKVTNSPSRERTPAPAKVVTIADTGSWNVRSRIALIFLVVGLTVLSICIVRLRRRNSSA